MEGLFPALLLWLNRTVGLIRAVTGKVGCCYFSPPIVFYIYPFRAGVYMHTYRVIVGI